jgi:hypothetical protein
VRAGPRCTLKPLHFREEATSVREDHVREVRLHPFQWFFSLGGVRFGVLVARRA